MFFLESDCGAHLSSTPRSRAFPTSMHHTAMSPSRYDMPFFQSSPASRVITPYSGTTCLRGTSSTPVKDITPFSLVMSPNWINECPK